MGGLGAVPETHRGGDIMALYSSSGGSDGERAVDSLRLTDSEWLAYVAELDRESARHIDASTERRHERVAYRNVVHLLATLHNQDGRTQKFMVRTHDLSESGMGFLHGSFIYPQSRIQLVLHHRMHGQSYHDGIVRRCEHFKRHIHRIGVEFDKPITLEDYLLAAKTG